MGAYGVSQLIDDNGKGTMAYTPSTNSLRLTGIESTTVRSGTTISSLVRIVATGAVNYTVRAVTTDAVTTSMAYLPANTIEYVKVVKGKEEVSFLGSAIIYVTSLR